MRSMDLLTPGMTLHISDYRTHKNNIGGIITILIIFSSLAFSVLLCLDLFTVANPKTTSWEEFSFFPEKIEISDQGINHTISLFSRAEKKYLTHNSRIANLKGQMTYLNGTVISSYNYGACTYKGKIIFKLKLGNEDLILNSNTSLCIISQIVNDKIAHANSSSFNYPMVTSGKRNFENEFHKIISSDSSIYKISILKCQNSTDNNFTCLPREQIDKYFNEASGDLSYVLNFVDKSYNPFNYLSPVSSDENSFVINNFSSSSTKVKKLTFQKIKFSTDDGWIFNNNKTLESYKLSKFEEFVNINNSQFDNNLIIGEVYFNMQNKIINHRRSYAKLQSVLAEVFGVIKLLTLIGSGTNYVFYKCEVLKSTISVYRSKFVEEMGDSNFKNESRERHRSFNNPTNTFQHLNLNINKLEINKQNLNDDNFTNFQNKNQIYIQKKHPEKKYKITVLKYICNFIKRKKDSFYDQLMQFRNFVLNETTIYDLYFDVIKIKKVCELKARELDLIKIPSMPVSINDYKYDHEVRKSKQL